MIETKRLNDEIKNLEAAYALETDQKERDRIDRIIERSIFRLIIAYSNEHPAQDRVSARIR